MMLSHVSDSLPNGAFGGSSDSEGGSSSESPGPHPAGQTNGQPTNGPASAMKQLGSNDRAATFFFGGGLLAPLSMSSPTKNDRDAYPAFALDDKTATSFGYASLAAPKSGRVCTTGGTSLSPSSTLGGVDSAYVSVNTSPMAQPPPPHVNSSMPGGGHYALQHNQPGVWCPSRQQTAANEAARRQLMFTTDSPAHFGSGGQSSARRMAPPASARKFDDSSVFMDAVPYPQRPTRNTFIEPGSGMRDVPMWLKGLRLHKYTTLFQQMDYDQMIQLDEQQLDNKGVTKGARKKIVCSVEKLKERVDLIKQLEKDVVEPGGVRTTLVELKQMVHTPIRAYPLQGRPEPDQSKIDGLDLPADVIDNENLPAHMLRVVSLVQRKMVFEADVGRQLNLDDECYHTLFVILDRCITHEAFTLAQKRRCMAYKQALKKIWTPQTRRRLTTGANPHPPSGGPPCPGAPDPAFGRRASFNGAGTGVGRPSWLAPSRNATPAGNAAWMMAPPPGFAPPPLHRQNMQNVVLAPPAFNARQQHHQQQMFNSNSLPATAHSNQRFTPAANHNTAAVPPPPFGGDLQQHQQQALLVQQQLGMATALGLFLLHQQQAGSAAGPGSAVTAQQHNNNNTRTPHQMMVAAATVAAARQLNNCTTAAATNAGYPQAAQQQRPEVGDDPSYVHYARRQSEGGAVEHQRRAGGNGGDLLTAAVKTADARQLQHLAAALARSTQLTAGGDEERTNTQTTNEHAMTMQDAAPVRPSGRRPVLDRSISSPVNAAYQTSSWPTMGANSCDVFGENAPRHVAPQLNNTVSYTDSAMCDIGEHAWSQQRSSSMSVGEKNIWGMDQLCRSVLEVALKEATPLAENPTTARF